MGRPVVNTHASTLPTGSLDDSWKARGSGLEVSLMNVKGARMIPSSASCSQYSLTRLAPRRSITRRLISSATRLTSLLAMRPTALLSCSNMSIM